MDEQIKWNTPGHDENKSVQIEGAVWTECEKSANELWNTLLNKNLLSYRVERECPQSLVSVMHSHIMWNVPAGWNLYEEEKKPPTFWAKIKSLWT